MGRVSPQPSLKHNRLIITLSIIKIALGARVVADKLLCKNIGRCASS
jgi:hypothetical protein